MTQSCFKEFYTSLSRCNFLPSSPYRQFSSNVCRPTPTPKVQSVAASKIAHFRAQYYLTRHVAALYCVYLLLLYFVELLYSGYFPVRFVPQHDMVASLSTRYWCCLYMTLLFIFAEITPFFRALPLLAKVALRALLPGLAILFLLKLVGAGTAIAILYTGFPLCVEGHLTGNISVAAGGLIFNGSLAERQAAIYSFIASATARMGQAPHFDWLGFSGSISRAMPSFAQYHKVHGGLATEVYVLQTISNAIEQFTNEQEGPLRGWWDITKDIIDLCIDWHWPERTELPSPAQKFLDQSDVTFNSSSAVAEALLSGVSLVYVVLVCFAFGVCGAGLLCAFWFALSDSAEEGKELDRITLTKEEFEDMYVTTFREKVKRWYRR